MTLWCSTRIALGLPVVPDDMEQYASARGSNRTKAIIEAERDDDDEAFERMIEEAQKAPPKRNRKSRAPERPAVSYIGRRCEILFEDANAYFNAKVVAHAGDQLTVEYEDGTTEALSLSQQAHLIAWEGGMPPSVLEEPAAEMAADDGRRQP